MLLYVVCSSGIHGAAESGWDGASMVGVGILFDPAPGLTKAHIWGVLVDIVVDGDIGGEGSVVSILLDEVYNATNQGLLRALTIGGVGTIILMMEPYLHNIPIIHSNTILIDLKLTRPST